MTSTSLLYSFPISTDQPFSVNAEDFEDDDWQEVTIANICQVSPDKVRFIGNGKFGRVFRVEVPGPQKYIAVKLLQFSDTDTRSYPTRKEAVKEGSRKILHPHVLQTFDSREIHYNNQDLGYTQQYMCIAFEYVPKGDLGNLNLVFSETLLRKILTQSVDALDYMFQFNSFIHRDLKPENILVRSVKASTGDIDIVLADFGLTRSMATMKTNGIYGTPDYMAPEITTKDQLERYSTKSDIFSLGVSLIHLANEKVPYAIGKELQREEESVVIGKVTEVLECKKMSSEFIKILLGMIRKEPEKRWTYSQITQALQL